MQSDTQSRLEQLEELVIHDREQVGKRTGVPFIVFAYDPDDELSMDDEIEGFIRKLEFNDQDVATIDMRNLVFTLLDEQGILEGVIDRERHSPEELVPGLKSALFETSDALGPLPKHIAEAAEESDTVVVYRMGMLHPFASGSVLMGQLEGMISSDTPIVFFYPAIKDDKSLRFLDGSEGTYYRAKVI